MPSVSERIEEIRANTTKALAETEETIQSLKEEIRKQRLAKRTILKQRDKEILKVISEDNE